MTRCHDYTSCYRLRTNSIFCPFCGASVRAGFNSDALGLIIKIKAFDRLHALACRGPR